VSDDEIADVDSLTDDEKTNGITGEKTFVPYDKVTRMVIAGMHPHHIILIGVEKM